MTSQTPDISGAKVLPQDRLTHHRDLTPDNCFKHLSFSKTHPGLDTLQACRPMDQETDTGREKQGKRVLLGVGSSPQTLAQPHSVQPRAGLSKGQAPHFPVPGAATDATGPAHGKEQDSLSF